MSSFNQGVPTVPTLINSSNCIVLGNTSSGTALTVQQLGAGAVMNVATSTGSSALFVSSTGQVGVGTASPATALDVFTGTMNAATVVATTLTGAGSGITSLNMGNAGSGTLAVARGGTGTTTSTGTGSVVLSASPALSGTATFAAITTSGNVGIGYYSPQSILHVQVGDVVPTASGNMATGMIISQASGGPAMCLGARTTGGNYTWIHSAYTNNSGVAAPLVLQPIGGNVGIGVTNPGYTLDVNGTVNLTGLRLNGLAGGNSLGYGAYMRGSVNTTGGVGWGAIQEFYYSAGSIPTGTWTNIVAQSTLGTAGIKNAFVHVRMFGAWWGTIQTIVDSSYAGYPSFVSNSPCYQSGFEVRFSGGYLQVLQISGGNAGMDIIVTKIGW